MKGQMIAALEAMEILLENNFKPRRTIYFVLGMMRITGKRSEKHRLLP